MEKFKIDLEKFFKYESMKRELFMKHFVELANELNGNVIEETKKKLAPYLDVLTKFDGQTEEEKQKLLDNPEVKEAFSILKEIEEQKDKLIFPEFDVDFLKQNLTISETELKQYLTNGK